MSKSIIITESKNIQKYFKSILKQKGLEFVEEPLLYDIETIKNSIKDNKNTSEIRNKFGEHIKKFGLPLILVLDYMINLGLDKESDPDHRKLLRTFIIAYAILLQGKGYNQSKNIIVLIGDERMTKHFQLFQKKPHLLFKLVKVSNVKVNKFLDMYANNPELAKNNFRVEYLFKPEGGVITGQLNQIGDIATMALRVNNESVQIKHNDLISAKKLVQNPANINLEYKFANGKMVRDGITSEQDSNLEASNNTIQSDKNVEMLNDTLYVSGDWVSVNQMEVADKIASFFEKKIKPVWEQEIPDAKNKRMPISIFLTDDVNLEKGMIPSLIQLIEHRLNKIGKVSLYISKKNREEISSAAGFSFLESYFLNSL